MPAPLLDRPAPQLAMPAGRRASITLAAAVLGFFVVTLDAVVVNVALPAFHSDFGAGIAGRRISLFVAASPLSPPFRVPCLADPQAQCRPLHRREPTKR